MTEPTPTPPCPPFNYTKYEVDDYDIPYETHLTSQPPGSVQYKHVANGSYVIQPTSALPPPYGPSPSPPLVTTTTSTTDPTTPKILLIQRAAHDSWPNRWEIPGGACDPGEASMLDSVARELWEEAGLTATRVGPLVGGTKHLFTTRTGNLVCRFSFLVDVLKKTPEAALEVTLDPNEHQAFVWATEEEVRVGRVGDVELVFTNQATREGVMEAFRVWNELRQGTPTV
ncbi:hypothetical protein LTR84_007484 [Exophiala bonariae]|uniref:Nudix hydrolase domain-containing protein n=1 Tax=Exophiala bonariae TaxID=1690606 RepID=A0AAV9N1N8_9EURO|nr:hypothetical protein LTR84_007484 [Exophiala bonariae]